MHRIRTLFFGFIFTPTVDNARTQYYISRDDEMMMSDLESSVAALPPPGDDPQLAADERLVAELRRLSVENLCRFGYEAAMTMSSEIGT